MIWAHSPAATQLFFRPQRSTVDALRLVGRTAAVWTSLTICLPLQHHGDHWLSDIVAGAVVAVALMLLLCRLIGTTGLPDRVVRFSAIRQYSTLLHGCSPLRLHSCLATSRCTLKT